MGIFDRFSADKSAARTAAKALEAQTAESLPPGWRYRHTHEELLGSRPASHRIHVAWAEAPDGMAAALAQDHAGALHELSRLASGHSRPTRGWALPNVAFQGTPEDFRPGVSNAPDYEARIAAWKAAKACLPAGSVLSGAKKESIGLWGTQVYGVSAHLPDGTDLAVVALTGAAAYETLTAHLAGELLATPSWTIRHVSPTAPGHVPGGHR